MEACPEGRRGLISAFGFLITQTAGNRLTWIHRTRAIPATGSVKTRAPSRDTLVRNNDGMDQLRVTTRIATWLRAATVRIIWANHDADARAQAPRHARTLNAGMPSRTP